MNIGEYIKAKYGNRCITVTSKEATILGIAYPLKHGWYDELHSRKISAAQLDDIEKALKIRHKSKNKKYAQNALNAIQAVKKHQPIPTHTLITNNRLLCFLIDYRSILEAGGTPDYGLDFNLDEINQIICAMRSWKS